MAAIDLAADCDSRRGISDTQLYAAQYRGSSGFSSDRLVGLRAAAVQRKSD
jgi:hypothetical protein